MKHEVLVSPDAPVEWAGWPTAPVSTWAAVAACSRQRFLVGTVPTKSPLSDSVFHQTPGKLGLNG